MPVLEATLKTETRDMKNKTRGQALASAGILLVSLALAACGSVVSARPVSAPASAASAPASSASPGFSGYDWQVIAIGKGGKVTPIPARLKVDLRFSSSGQFVASDGIHGISGTYRTAKDGFTTGLMAKTANGYIGNDPAIVLAIRAMESFGNPATYSATLTGDRLVVDVGPYKLTCHRAGPQA
jgi:hypothetical protein